MAKKGNKNKGVKSSNDTIEHPYIIHIVEKGDTLHNLAAKHLGSMSRANEIKRLNEMHNEFLFIGNKLKIPKK